MTHPGRRLLAGIATLATLGTLALTAVVSTAAPAAAAPSTPALGLPLCTLLHLPQALCDLLGSGIPNPLTSADPSSFPNTATAQAVTVSDQLAPLYADGGGATVQLIDGPAGTGVINGTVGSFSDSDSAIPVTFDLADPLPAGPGSYTLNVTPTSLSTVLGLLSELGLGSDPLPLDSTPVTITADAPTPTAKLVVQPGKSTPATINTSSTPFAVGDAVTFTDSTGAAVSGLTLTGAGTATSPTMTSTSITGTLNATSAVTDGTYNLVVTDTAGQTGTCTGCVTVNEGPSAPTDLKATANTSSTASLTWKAPASTTPAVTGYAVTVSKSATATANDSGINVTQTGTTPSATVSGLTAGTKYYVSVSAKSSGGNSAAATTTFTTPFATSLSLASSASNVTAGHSLTLSGELDAVQGGSKTGLGNELVGIYDKPTGGKLTLLTAAKTDSSGQYHYTFKPQKSAEYVVIFFGDPGTASTPGDSLSFSNEATSTLTPTLTLSAKFHKHHKNFTLKAKGKVNPAEKGHKVLIYRFKGGGLSKIGHAKVKSNGSYKMTKKHMKKGTYHLQAQIGAHAGVEAGQSKKVTVHA